MSLSIGSIGHAFATAIHDAKMGAKAVAAFITQNKSKIDATVQEVGDVITFLDPALGPVVNTVERIESAAMGELCAVCVDLSLAPDVKTFAVNLPSELLPQIKALADRYVNHPAVAAVKG
ncbi:MAG TPA: hypothetical protein VGM97_10100 [Steroidobacteraceae bacterium]|jgi:hypothetical protein